MTEERIYLNGANTAQVGREEDKRLTPSPIIYAYTRAQALEDGLQIRLEDEHAQMAREAGYKYPVYLTTGVLNLIEAAVNHPQWGNDWDGVLWDILWMSRCASRPLDPQTSLFTVIITGTGRKRNHQMLIQCGPTDFANPEPALTIMLPDED